MGVYPGRSMERAMKFQEVILRAMSKQITWWQASEILGMTPRNMRRYRARLEKGGYDGLIDQRTRRPSPKRVPMAEVTRVLTLYREQYFDFNVRHFHEKLRDEHQVTLSYTWVKNALQKAGLVAQSSKRGRHHKRRPRRPLPGMMLHVDGSTHAWLGCGQPRFDLVTLMDDATSEIYYARFVEQESTDTIMAGLRSVVASQGVFCSLYSDRASHFVYTPTGATKPDRSVRTQVARALEQLGIELIHANSPQARGRCERSYKTLQGRLPQELRTAGAATLEEANRVLLDYLPRHNQRFMVVAAETGTAFVPYTGGELDKVLSKHHDRVIANDNTVTFGKLKLQIERQTFRFSMARCRVLVCEHLDGTIAVYYGPNLLGRYTRDGQPVPTSSTSSQAA
ncbi:MAG: ISNCY family transposase [Actinobacteria bacterium]|nr:ISNCY family transposase [Actinomycetota bacterium]